MSTLIKVLLIAATFILLVATYFHPISAITQDLGRHIKTGEIIVKTLSVPKTNFYSYTNTSFPFINHHWGSEVLFYLIYQASGFTGTLFLSFVLSLIAFLLLYWYAYKQSNILALSLVSFFSLGILFERTDVRPEAISFLLFAICIAILFKNREKPTKWLYALIPLQFLWANMHIYWVIGIVTIGLFLLDSFITSFRHAKYTFPFSLFFVLIFCSLTTLLNPNGLSGALYPFRVFENYGYSIEENQNIFFLWEIFQKRTIVFFWTSVAMLFAVLSLRAKYTRPIDWLLAITFTALGIQAIRNFPLYVFAVFIPFAYHLSAIIATVLKTQNKKYLFLGICILLLFSWQLQYVITVKPIGIDTPGGASKAVDFLIAKKLKGPIFNNFDIGSYLIFRLYPERKVFVDGRPEAYPASFFQNTYIPMQQDPLLFTQVDKKYHFNTIFFSHTDQTPWAKQFLRDITHNKHWHIVYLDDTVIILVKKPIAPISLSDYNPSASSIQGLYQLLLFFQTIEDEQNMLKTAQAILQKDPHNCVALSLLSQAQTPTTLMYQARYTSACQ